MKPDQVVIVSKNLVVMFTGTPTETREWLLAQPMKEVDQTLVKIGETGALISPVAYIRLGQEKQ